MNTKLLEKFAQAARRQLQEQVAAKLERVLRTDSAELRERADAVKELKQQIDQHGRAVVIERVAYTWFNRFCALRYMDANHFTRIGTVSPAAGFTQPELLQEAKQGHIDDELTPFVKPQTVLDLLSGRLPSPDPQQEAYRLLLVAVCNYYHTIMPFLFERIADYTELLMPDDLLSAGSLLSAVREALTAENCQDVEVIGWLYQFYITEKKDEIFAALKQNQKVTAENIPAVTQLFTPDWIVGYLVENSLGRLWLLNRPNSELVKQMPYYIRSAQQETDFLRINSPEEIKLCDPAAGSGHMLTYAFDLLYAIYEDEGYNAPDISSLILEKNLYGIEIDERAGALAAFALTMKARGKDRRFFQRKIYPHICVLHPVVFKTEELSNETWFKASADLQDALLHDLHLFAEVGNFGSLLRPRLSANEIAKVRGQVNASATGQIDWMQQHLHQQVVQAIDQVEYLARKYHVVVANPPFLGNQNANSKLKSFLDSQYNEVKSDLFSAFIVRNLELALPKGYVGFVTPFVWMFLSSYEKLRNLLLSKKTICNLVKPSYTSFFASAIVSLVTFVVKNYLEDLKGDYIDLGYLGSAESQPIKLKEAILDPDCGWYYRASAADFKKIPGSPIAYWASERMRQVFQGKETLGDIAPAKIGMRTGDNNRFLRLWFEVPNNDFGIGFKNANDARSSGKKWFPYNKGGNFRKWYGNNEYVVCWENDGYAIKKSTLENYPQLSWDKLGWKISNEGSFFLPAVTWTFVSFSNFGVRITEEGFLFDVGGSCAFPPRDKLHLVAAFLCSKLPFLMLKIMNPTQNFQVSNVGQLPWVGRFEGSKDSDRVSKYCFYLAKRDWDYFEISWDFAEMPLLQSVFRTVTLSTTYTSVRAHWQEMTLEMQRLEEENNRIFINAYGLQDELTPDVPLAEITLTCNPYYRYDAKKPAAELEKLLLADTMREFISYAVGCMFGRYSLDKPGLILANQGETVEDYLRQVPNPTFPPDKDNVIPMLDGDWFIDDISERFKRFLRVTFGEPHYGENLAFIEAALGRDLRNYFLREFYDDHARRYQKRPIYWLFSSPKGSFNALIYMHRYQPHTVSVVLNDYLREFITKLNARKSHLQTISISAAATPRDKTTALKEIDKLDKVLAELTEYENEILYPLATRQVQIDLDDGVKVNYNKFGKALRKITGLSE